MKLPPDVEAKVLEQATGPRLSPGYAAKIRPAVEAFLNAKTYKFGNVPVYHDGIFFQSTKEGDRYLILKDDLRRGRITDLTAQTVVFKFTINGVTLPQTYRPDFVYLRNGIRVVEDVKGHKTELYKLKKALMLAVHGIEILET